MAETINHDLLSRRGGVEDLQAAPQPGVKAGCHTDRRDDVHDVFLRGNETKVAEVNVAKGRGKN